MSRQIAGINPPAHTHTHTHTPQTVNSSATRPGARGVENHVCKGLKNICEKLVSKGLKNYFQKDFDQNVLKTFKLVCVVLCAWGQHILGGGKVRKG